MERHALTLGGSNHGRYQDVVAKHILLLSTVGLVLLRPLVVERTADADARIISLTGSGIDVGHELVAQVDTLQHGGEILVLPDAPLVACLTGTMGAEDG